MIDPDRFRRVDALLDAALALPEMERAAYLDKACAGDAALLAEVTALLETVRTAESLFGENVADFAGELVAGLAEREAVEALPAGTVLGGWRIRAELGRGGMGAVYLAERADDAFTLLAAVKVVKRGMDTDEILRRFRAERRIVASLDHPNIARVLDGGVTPDGRPYLVMEYVDGEPIDAWCDAHDLDVRRRVTLFRDVCEAVHQAHRRLVVHRDVKPSNVLVTGAGVPKLLDFGIAKLLDDADGERTATSVRMLTPDYAAPEQLTGEPVTTATDVYALGGLLHRLLTGATTRTAAGESVRTRGAADVIPPSQVIARSMSGDDAARADIGAVAAARGTSPDRLRATVRGDLDTIVLRALAADPARRYGSALQLAEDLDRWLRGLPVLARPDSRAYRTVKFIRRNRAGVAAGAAAAVLLFAFAISMAAAQRRTAEALERAESERDTAEEVATVLEDIFSAGDPTAGRPGRLDTMRVAALLERSAARVRDELGDRPIVQARLLRALGEAYRGMGRFDVADPLLREAVAAQRRLDDDAALAEALNELGLLELQRGRSADAEPWLREAVALRRAGAAEPAQLAITLSNLAAALQDQAKFPDAVALYEEAERSLTAADTSALATVLNGRARLADRMGDLATAADVADRILSLDRARLGATHPRVGIGLVNVGYVNQRLGRLERADSLYAEGVAVLRSALGESHPMVFSGMAALANVRSVRGLHAEARPLFEAAIAGTRRAVGPSPELAITLSQYADMLAAAGSPDQAEIAVREAIETERQASGPTHPSVGVTTAQLANLRCARDDFDGASAHFQDALTVLEAAFPPSHPRVVDARASWAGCLTRGREYARAEALLVASFEAVVGSAAAAEPASAARRIAAGLADLYDAWRRPDDAAAYRALADTTSSR